MEKNLTVLNTKFTKDNTKEMEIGELNNFLLGNSIIKENCETCELARLIAKQIEKCEREHTLLNETTEILKKITFQCTKHKHMIDSESGNKEYKCESESTWNNGEPTRIVILKSPLKGNIDCPIDKNKVLDTVFSSKDTFQGNCDMFYMYNNNDYRSKNFWDETATLMECDFTEIVNMYNSNPIITLSVFPITPIPMLIKWGYLFGNKIKAKVYQYCERYDTWNWISENKTNKFSYYKEDFTEGSNIALVLSITTNVDIKEVKKSCDADKLYVISAKRKGDDAINSKKDLEEFCRIYHEVITEIKNNNSDVQSINLFPHIPTSAAFEIGRRHIKGLYPSLKIYEDKDGYFETITISD